MKGGATLGRISIMHFKLAKVTLRNVTANLAGILVSVTCTIAVAQNQSPASGKFDEFRYTLPEDAMARLDAFAKALSTNSDLRGFLVGHNEIGLRRGWFLRHLYGYQKYLTDFRGIPQQRLTVIEGETKGDVITELWLLPTRAPTPVRESLPLFELSSPIQFDSISIGDEHQCTWNSEVELYTLPDALKFFGEALRRQPSAKAWIVVYPRVRDTRENANRTIDESKSLLRRGYGISDERLLVAVAKPRSSSCATVNLWVAPSDSVEANEACYYAQLIQEAEQTEYTVRRVEFSGNVHIRDNTLRRGFLQQEGDVFSRKLVEKSLRNFSKIASVYPVTFDDVEVRLDRDEKLMDFTIYFRERPSARRRSRKR